VHDGVHVEKAGIPAAVICTDRFKVTGEAMAKMWGAPEFPILYTAHPVGGLDRDKIRAKAEELIDQVIAVLTGVDVSQVKPQA